MKHFYILLTTFFLVFFSGVKAQNYCNSSIGSDISDWNETNLTEICVSFSPAAEPGCVPHMAFFENAQFNNWHQNILGEPEKWHQVPPNTDIDVTIVMEFESNVGIGELPIFPFSDEVLVYWGIGNFTAPLDFEWDFVTGSASCMFTFNTGNALWDNPNGFSDHLEVIFFDNNNSGVEKYAVAAEFIVEDDRMVNNPLWTTSSPAAPQLILRDPPGDGSYSTVSESTETCTGHAISLATNESASAWASAKLGVTGEVGGLVYSTEVETYVEITGGVEMGIVQNTVDEAKMCFRVSNEYTTSINDPVVSLYGGDLYIGSSIEYAYGIYESVRIEGCNLVNPRELAFLPTGSSDYFIYPEGYIVNVKIPELELALATLTPGSDAYIEAEDALEVWNEYIQLNADIKADAILNQEPISRTLIGNTASSSFFGETSTSQTREVTHDMYIEASVAIEAGIYAAGSGVAGGVSVKARTTKGNANSTSTSNQEIVGYTLNDGDNGDVFNIDVYEDDTFGTHIFVLDEASSATSCPYEGGALLDNPGITFTSDNSTDMVIENIPNQGYYTFEVDICNESDNARVYNAIVPPQSNTNGLQVVLAGTPINVTDGVSLDIIPANSCITFDVTISQTTGSSELDYEDVQIKIYPDCQPNFEPSISVITFDAYFSTVNGIKELDERNDLMHIFPNPNSGQFQVKIEDLSEVSTLEIKDLTGRTVYKSQVKPNNQNLTIDLGQVSQGVYLIMVYNTNERMTQKMVIH